MSSEGGVERGTAAFPSSGLRPGAPVFVPSASSVFVAAAAKTVGSVPPPDVERGDYNNRLRVRDPHSDRQPGNQTRKKKKKSQRQRQGQQRRKAKGEMTSCKVEPDSQNIHSKNHKLGDTKKKNKNSSKRSDQSRRSKKYNRNTKPKSRASSGKGNRNHTGNENGDDYQTQEESCHINKCYDNNCASEDTLELASSLAFPALMEEANAPSSLGLHKLQSTIWNSVEGVRDLREGQVQQVDHILNDIREALGEDETAEWQNGLDRLTGRDRKAKQIHVGHRRQEFLSWDESETPDERKDGERQSHEIKKNVSVGNRTERSPMHVAQEKSDVVYSEKRTFNINRLRDRWWTAVAEQQRRLQQQQQEELEERQTETCGEIIHDDLDGNIQTNYGPGDVQEHSIGCAGNAQSDEMHSSVLQHKVNHIIPLYQRTASKIKLLDLIIEQEDDQALRGMIELAWSTDYDNESLQNHVILGKNDGRIDSSRAPSFEILEEESIEECDVDLVEYAITLLIRRNHPNLLRTILSITRGKVPINSKPLIQAAKLGHEECGSILLSKQEKGSTMLFLDDTDGNTALHYCCRENGNKDMLVTLLKQVAGTTKRKRQQLSKLVTARNKYLQTPLHVACEAGRNDLVEVFLTTCKSSVLFKVLSIEDTKLETPLLCAVSNDSCDVVLSLLMWRRNHDHQPQSRFHIYSATGDNHTKNERNDQSSESIKAKNTACPLVWAAKSGNLNMIDLLIQLGDQSGTRFKVTDALLTLLRSDIPNETKFKGSNSLILAGGNPFQEIPHRGLIDGQKETSIGVAAKVASDDIIRSVISTALHMVDKRQLARRRDPILQHQPEAFFTTLESKENYEANRAISHALIESLFRAYSNQKQSDFSNAFALYEKIENVGEEYIIELQNRLRSEKMSSSIHQSKNWCFLAAYRHTTNAITDGGSERGYLHFDLSVFAKKSLSLIKLPWVQNEISKTECFCPWVSRNSKNRHSPPALLPNDAISLIANDGSRFLVHAPTVSEKSGKLASALRFARMQRDGVSLDEPIELDLDIAPDFCKILIQHMYHGSICFGWPNLEENELCRYFLELMIVAEEFLIPSLVKEIEMRLISSTPLKCFCWDCCQALRCIPSDDGKMEAQCLFSVSGRSSLVNRNTAMDVLSLTDYIGGLDYSIFMAPIALELWVEPGKMWGNYDREVTEQKSWKLMEALAFLRNVAVITILRDFHHVVNSPDFVLTTDGDQREGSQKQILLQICLTELQNNSATTLACSSPPEKVMDPNRKG